MPLSPRTQSMMQGPADPEAAFEAGFQELAFTQLVSQLPEIADKVASLKVLEVSPETNSAVGTFIIIHGNDEIHVPAILSDNELMPFDVMYVKSLDMMLPLTQDWLATLQEMDVAAMGQAVEPPKTLRTDEDIRNLVVPPTTGRYSYASDSSTRLLPEYLKLASNEVKRCFVETLKRHPLMAKHAFEIYGVDVIQEATRPHVEKVATSTQHAHFMTIETPVSEIKEVFGDRAPDAMRDIALKGYSTLDQRDQVNQVVDVERPLALEVPGAPGFYRTYCADGSVKDALVFTHVRCFRQLAAQRNMPPKSRKAMVGSYHDKDSQPRLGVTADGQMFLTSKDFMAEALEADGLSAALKNYVTKPRPGTPRNGQRGFFFDPDSKDMTATEPFKIELVTNKDGSRQIKAKAYDSYDDVMIHQVKGSSITKPIAFSPKQDARGERVYENIPWRFLTKGEQDANKDDAYADLVVMIPEHWRFVPIDSIVHPNDLIGDPSAVKALFHDALTASGAEVVKVKEAGAGLLWLDGKNLTPQECVRDLALSRNVSFADAESIVKTAQELRQATALVLRDGVLPRFKARLKLAQKGGSMVAAEQPPVEEAPAMMAPPEPPPPSPVEIAAQEVAQQLLQQNDMVTQQLMTQQQSLETQLSAVQAVMERATQISAEIGLPTPGGEAMDPMAGQMGPPPQDPMMGGTPPMGPQDPMMGGAPPQGMDPMMGGAPMGPPPGAGMPVEEPNMMELAMGGMMDPELFDAAAISQMATANDYDNTVQQFTPSLREALNSLGRLLLEMRMRGSEMKTAVGEDVYGDMRDRLELLFSEMGTALLGLGDMTTQYDDESPN